MISGQSAGALAVFTWMDFFKDYFGGLNPQIEVMGVADCGM